MKIHKAVIMAAGKGTRMLPLTEKIPKVLIPINGKPFLYYIIENLKKAGITEFGIITGYLKEKIEDFVKEYNLNATLIEQKEQLGTGHALMQAKEFCKEDNFIVLGGDNLWSADDFTNINKDDDLNYIAGITSTTPEKFGVLIIDEKGKLIEIKEKPKEFAGNVINTALYKFTPEIFTALDAIKRSERGEYELTDAVTLLAQQGKVKIIDIKDYWIDLGSIEDISKVEEALAKLF